MNELSYVSGAATSTRRAAPDAAGCRRRTSGHLTPLLGSALLATLGLGACAAKTAAGQPAEAPPAAVAHSGARDANLGGARCQKGAGSPCQCRNRRGDPAEKSPPDEAHKRFEIRMWAEGGSASLDSDTLGHLAAGPDEACFYIDVLPGTTSQATFVAREGTRGSGIGPVLEIAEYGPKGPWWYEILSVRCGRPGAPCNRDAADAWAAEAKNRKRGRIDPCGSAVVSRLAWDTSGGVGDRELGLFRDFTVTFTLEVKRFATQFPPRSTECVPK